VNYLLRLYGLPSISNTPPEFNELKFPFIPDKEETMLGGVTVASEIKNKIL
jgi:hypothetical protein